ncbi:D-amino-acid transaminase [candidate division LCP-89 bacterium B3_LCP]|uniref:D-alanine aminotransferase n=1 Tax=candidate division LCP-89 bacterium B3_LCP TaxID=2012998 RepID=A0A532V251_UNCL8|nr:MAG: D-amino-acid transaminase [candidate division LCP-89 bacterium B3_LCP]
MISYLNGHYLPKGEIAISPDDRGFLFADGLYEVMRSYDGEIFQPQAHIERLSYGAEQLRFQQMEFSFLIEVAEELIGRNQLNRGDAIIYIQVTRGIAPRLHKFPPPGTSLTVYATIRPFQPKTDEMTEGINVIFVPDQRWARTDIKSIGLLPNVLAQQRAMENNAAEAVFIRDGAITEGTRSNFFAVIGGTVITRPRTNYILAGITRKMVIEICQKSSIPFQERSIFETEAHEAQELFIAGTTVEVTPVVQIEGKNVGNGKPGPITMKLQKAFAELVHGTIEVTEKNFRNKY